MNSLTLMDAVPVVSQSTWRSHRGTSSSWLPWAGDPAMNGMSSARAKVAQRADGLRLRCVRESTELFCFSDRSIGRPARVRQIENPGTTDVDDQPSSRLTQWNNMLVVWNERFYMMIVICMSSSWLQGCPSRLIMLYCASSSLLGPLFSAPFSLICQNQCY